MDKLPESQTRRQNEIVAVLDRQMQSLWRVAARTRLVVRDLIQQKKVRILFRTGHRQLRHSIVNVRMVKSEAKRGYATAIEAMFLDGAQQDRAGEVGVVDLKLLSARTSGPL